jgi:hypothetical protein
MLGTFFSPLAHKYLIFLALAFAFAGVVLVSAAFGSSPKLERRVKRLADDGYPWIEIRTRVPDPD